MDYPLDNTTQLSPKQRATTNSTAATDICSKNFNPLDQNISNGQGMAFMAMASMRNSVSLVAAETVEMVPQAMAADE